LFAAFKMHQLIKGTDPSQSMLNAGLGSIFAGGLSQAGQTFGLNPQIANQIGGLGSKYFVSEFNKSRKG